MNSPNSPNIPSPLVPQGSMLDQKNSSRSRVKIAFFCVVGVHVAGLLVLLMQGCKREPSGAPDTGTQPVTAATPTDNVASNPPPLDPIQTNVAQPTDVATPVTPPPTQPPGAAQEYVIQKGDSFYTIARKFNVTQKAIQDANPGVDPLKLQLGHKLMIPPPTPATPAATGNATAETPGVNGEIIYTVKSGDVLGSIATHYKVSVKAIQQANNLSDTRIKVGQKLKIPKASSAPMAAPPP